ncbi:MAG: hypothetical protein H7A25_16250 [Leptospiraceae bacterium]|nr:hypothetical protein [Leptospiraceae bacterium]
MRYLISLVFTLAFQHCVESKSSGSDKGAAVAAYLLLQSGSACLSETNLPAIDTVTRKEYKLVQTNCTTQLGSGFIAENLGLSNRGLTGSSTSSRFASPTSYSLSSSKKTNVEITYTLNSTSGHIDVIMNAQASAASIQGPGVRIKSTLAYPLNQSGIEGSFTGSVPQSPVGTKKTLCLEIHEENGAHIFGWSKSCASLSTAERSSYEFEVDSFQTTHPGSNIGFVLNSATLESFIVSQGAIGLASRFLESK